MSAYIPPWSSPYIIGIAGLSGSGKTTVAQEITNSINQPWTILLSLDNFYKDLTPEQSKLAYSNEFDFDKPDAYDFDAIIECVRNIKAGKKVDIPVYSFKTHSRQPNQKITIYGANVVIIEGIMSLFHPELLKLMDFKVFVDTDIDICYSRRLLRDIIHRDRSIEGVIQQWNKFVKPNSIAYVLPTRSNADIVIPRGSDNKIALSMLIAHLKRKLKEKSDIHIAHLNSLHAGPDMSRVHILPVHNQLKVLYTTILDSTTSSDDFIFNFNRIASLLITFALDFIPYESGVTLGRTITTPTNHSISFSDAYFQTSNVIGVSMIRSGDVFQRALRQTIPSVQIGKLLIQADSRTGEPQLHTEKLPEFTVKDTILLFEAEIISGTAGVMAIKVLLDHGVKEDQIIIVSYRVTEIALRRIFAAFPKVTVVTGGVEDIDARIIDDRYFGTV